MLGHPAYGLDLSLDDVHVFGQLKKTIRGCTFMSDDNVQEAVVQWSRQQSKELFADRIC
jgi:hypothetical protein